MSNAEFIVVFMMDEAREKRQDDDAMEEGGGRVNIFSTWESVRICSLMAQVAGELTHVTPSHLQARTV